MFKTENDSSKIMTVIILFLGACTPKSPVENSISKKYLDKSLITGFTVTAQTRQNYEKQWKLSKKYRKNVLCFENITFYHAGK